MSEETAVYTQKVLEIASQLHADKRLEHPDATARKVSRVCGSRVEVDLSVRDGVVADYGHEVDACALGQTSASVVEHHVIGATEDEVRLAHAQLTAMLKADGPPPTGRFADLGVLESVRNYTPRHKSILLVFEALIDCFDQIRLSREGATG
ncbi:MAG: iron-sulfur cluster assembly scaffold protein [Hyphomicrobiaceae bacterium]|nr:iron-sulfur cluster assembly scaffold protein [Hyphomicrobiaceae bacterium]